MAQEASVVAKTTDDLFAVLRAHGVDIGLDQERRIREELDRKFSYVPKIGVLGKTGVGKSSLANALFGKDVCPVSDVEACTREPQQVIMRVGGEGIGLLDVPGVGETDERDVEYGALYASLLPELDAVFWVLKADERAYARDYEFFGKLVRPYIQAGKPFFILLNQADKIEPVREWDMAARRPGPKQQANLDAKIQAVALGFDVPASKVLPVSANERYNLVHVIDELAYALPPDHQVTFVREMEALRPENVSAGLSQGARKRLWQVVDGVAEFVLPPPVKLLYKGVRALGEMLWDTLGLP